MFEFLKNVFKQIFAIDDTPQKISLGFGLGVFFGVMPGMGPIISVLFSVIFRLNRASALAGSLMTNAWLSIPVFFAAVAVGDIITGVSYKDMVSAWTELNKNFTWDNLLTLSVYKIAIPVIIGYLIVSIFLAVSAYFIVLAALNYAKRYKYGAGRINK